MQIFFSHSPQEVDRQGAEVPAQLIEVLMDPSGDWVSEHWTSLFKSTMVQR